MTPKDLLKTHDLRSTNCREEILTLFLRTPHALSQGDIEREFSKTLDRVTIYRTLRTFVEYGVLHKVLDDQGSPKYAPCADSCKTNLHRHDHIHFKCLLCEQTSCLDIHIPGINLPPGFQANEINLLAQGICDKCTLKHPNI